MNEMLDRGVTEGFFVFFDEMVFGKPGEACQRIEIKAAVDNAFHVGFNSVENVFASGSARFLNGRYCYRGEQLPEDMAGIDEYWQVVTGVSGVE